MKQLIDKSAIIAEIENWMQHTLKCGYAGQGEYEEGNKQGRLDTCEKFLSFLDTLEAKEDLETFDKEVTKMWGRCAANPNDTIACLHIDSFIEIARHFYELGLKGE